MAKAKEPAQKSIKVQEIKRGTITVCIVGTSPLICNSMSAKAAQELLLPKKSTKERRSGLKHDVRQEFRDSVYFDSDDGAPTFITGLSAWFKRAMVDATVDMPEATKAGVGRNVWVQGERVHIYGMPHLFMSTVRSAGMNKTPDIRTRAILPEWACEVTIDFASPQLHADVIVQLLAAAGIVMGVGDWRPEKGSGNYGQFRVCDAKDKEFKRIKSTLGRNVQLEAFETCPLYDDETSKLFGWYCDELERRGIA